MHALANLQRRITEETNLLAGFDLYNRELSRLIRGYITAQDWAGLRNFTETMERESPATGTALVANTPIAATAPPGGRRAGGARSDPDAKHQAGGAGGSSS